MMLATSHINEGRMGISLSAVQLHPTAEKTNIQVATTLSLESNWCLTCRAGRPSVQKMSELICALPSAFLHAAVYRQKQACASLDLYSAVAEDLLAAGPYVRS